MGAPVTGKSVIVVDDMIASGQSILEVAEQLKSRGAEKIYLIASFALFSDGKDSVDYIYTITITEGYKNNPVDFEVTNIPDSTTVGETVNPVITVTDLDRDYIAV